MENDIKISQELQSAVIKIGKEYQRYVHMQFFKRHRKVLIRIEDIDIIVKNAFIDNEKDKIKYMFEY